MQLARLVRVALVSAAVLCVSASLGSIAAASDFWDALRAGPNGDTRRAARLRLELRAGRTPDALAELEASSQEASASFAMRLLFAYALQAESRPLEAMAALERALAGEHAGHSSSELDHEVLALIRLTVGLNRPDLAAQLLDRYDAVSQSPAERASWLVLRGHVLTQLAPSSLPGAIAAYRAELRLAPDDAPALIGLALALHRQGDAAAALATARRVRDPLLLDRAPSGVRLPSAEISARLAIWRESVGDLEGARTAWQAAAREGTPFQQHAEQARARLAAP
jgi:tetratricopeptide (TPR) repeat protein